MMTEFGGAVAVPIAVRNSDSTTTMRVNDVIMTRIDGAIDSTVRQRDQLDRAFGDAPIAAGPEVDADVLGSRGPRQ